MRLFQKDAYIGIDFLDKKTEIIQLKEEADSDAFTFDIDTPSGKKNISMSYPHIQDTNAIFLELEAFTRSVLEKKPTAVSEVDGMMAMEVAHQILQKIQFSNLQAK